MNKPRRAPRRKVDGVLLLDKPAGMTSNAALQKVRWLFNAEKGGHTGTLDPLATGLLPLCLGEASKFSSELLDADKAYRATVLLGIVTDTADAEGQVLETRPVSVSEAELRALLPRFLGTQKQVPPMHSALKRDGVPLYVLARQGVEIERAARQIVIHAIDFLGWQEDRFEIEVACSKGTYIRTLAADIGAALGCGAHLAALRRTRIGRFDLVRSITLAEVETCDAVARDALLLPVDTLIEGLSVAELGPPDAARILHGQGIRWAAPPFSRHRLFAAGRFIGMGAVDADGWLQPRRLIATGGA